MNKAETLKTVRNLTPDEVLFSPAGRLKIALLQLVARLLPGRFAVWLSLLDDGRLERQVRIKLGPRSLFPGSSGYDVPRLHLIVEHRDWLALQEDALWAIQQSPDNPPSPQEQPKSGLSLKPIFDLLRRLDRDLAGVRGRIRINILKPDHPRTLTLALNDDALRQAHRHEYSRWQGRLFPQPWQVTSSTWTFPARYSTASCPANWT
ncbi:MAG: hypothetical protein IMY75_11905 [Chloroflexi bacterium]|nr:hypothetical protein [Chloroflexota bacterium]